MDLITWFEQLSFWAKIGIIVLILPFICFVVGVITFVLEPPGDIISKNKIWEAILGFTIFGCFIVFLVSAIFGITYIANNILTSFGVDSKTSLPIAFVISLFGFLFGIYYWFEARHYK